MRTQYRFGFRILRYNFIILVDQSFVKNGFESPPDRLDIIIGTGYVGMIHINPVSHALGEFPPPFAIIINMMIDKCPCLGIEFPVAIRYNLSFIFKTKFFFYGNLYG